VSSSPVLDVAAMGGLTMRGGVALPGEPGRRQRISAGNDFEAVREWLSSKASLSACTQESYLIAAKKFLWWLGVSGRSLGQFAHSDLDSYSQFCLQPPSDLPEGAPFRGPMSESSIQQHTTVLRGLFRWLTKARYIEDDPFDLLPTKRRKDGSKITQRFLSDSDWKWVQAAIDAMPAEKPVELLHKVRCDWLLNLLYCTGLRLSEVVENTMGGFVLLRSGEKQGWFLSVVGKGSKERQVPVPDALIDRLRGYRESLGLPRSIPPNDSNPLLSSLRGSKGIKRRALAMIIDEVFLRALNLARDAGEADEMHPALADGSTHWLRHTYGTKLGERGVSVVVIRDNLGHGSVATSSQYIHSDRLKRHQETIGEEKP